MSPADIAEWEKTIANLRRNLWLTNLRRAVIGGLKSVEETMNPLAKPLAGTLEDVPTLFNGALAPAMMPEDVAKNAKIQALKGVNRLYQRRRQMVPGDYTRDYFG